MRLDVMFIYLSLHHHKQMVERDVAQPGRVRVWGARGRKFESCHPDKLRVSRLCENIGG